MFSPDDFLNTQFEGANDTKSTPVPAGEYLAVVKEVKARQWQSKKDPTNSGIALDVVWDIDDAAVRELLGRDTVTVKQGIMLDLTDSGGLDMGKGRNIGLGRLREATHLNDPSQPFSFQQLAGQVARVAVSHRIDGDNIYAEVKSVAPV